MIVVIPPLLKPMVVHKNSVAVFLRNVRPKANDLAKVKGVVSLNYRRVVLQAHPFGSLGLPVLVISNENLCAIPVTHLGSFHAGDTRVFITWKAYGIEALPLKVYTLGGLVQ
jgi:hypothetical protein